MRNSILISVLLHLAIFAVVLSVHLNSNVVIKQSISIELVSSAPKKAAVKKETEEEKINKVLPKLLKEEKKVVVKKAPPAPLKKEIPLNIKDEAGKTPFVSPPPKKTPVVAPPPKEEPKTVLPPKKETKPVPPPIILKKDDNDFGDFLDDTITQFQDIPEDLEDNQELTDSEKSLVRDQMTKCWASLSGIREQDVIINLVIKMNEDGTMQNVEILKDARLLKNAEWEILETRIKSIFTRPQCMTLNLPVSKYNTWKNFSIKLTLKGFFR